MSSRDSSTRASAPRSAGKPLLEGRRILREVRPDDLERHIAVQVAVVNEVDGSHPTAPEQPDHHVALPDLETLG